MTSRERTLFWLFAIIGLLIALFFLRDVLLPFVAGMALAYFLDPLVDRCERAGMGRTTGTVIVLSVFTIIVFGFVLLLVPVIKVQADRLIVAAPAVSAMIEGHLESLLVLVGGSPGDTVLDQFPDVGKDAAKWIGGVLTRLISSGIALLNLLSLIFITPIVAFYLLRDWDKLVAAVDDLLPRAQAGTIREQMSAIDRTLASFLRGQAIVCVILGTFYAVCLSVVGLEFGLVIGLFAGLISFVPFVGAFIGGLMSIGFAMIQFAEPRWIVAVAAIFVAGQALEGNVLTPKLVGDAVGLHPVWVIFALLAGGTLFGFVGVLLSVPAAAVIGVLTRFGIARYKDSPLHRHGIPPADDED